MGNGLDLKFVLEMIDTAVLQEIAADKTRIAMKQDEKILDDALQVAIDAAHIAGRHMKAHLGTHVSIIHDFPREMDSKVNRLRKPNQPKMI